MSTQPKEPIAIVGSGCRFPGSVNSPSRLWELLRQPRDLQTEIPESRFSTKGFYHKNGKHHGHSNVSHAYLLDNDDQAAFDAEFFNIKAAEAKAMDPQQRLLLEVAFEALESAGLPIARLAGSDTAVYVGSMFDDYGTMLLRDLDDIPTYYATGTARSILPNRISHAFDWHGPSVSVDTACSSSLVAIHMAIQTLRSGESRTALACGTNLILGPENFVIESKLGMLSPDGRSRMWDQGANGYARGEGIAVLVLKTLSAALEDGDHIECVIRETGLNQDGMTPGGITMPSAAAQEALIRQTYLRAGLDVQRYGDRPQFVEVHGTGTPAGDPVEAEALYNVFGSSAVDYDTCGNGNRTPPLYAGSIKTVVGHTEGSAGVAAILKASLALQNACIPPNLLFQRLSERVAPFYKNIEIPATAIQWPEIVAGSTRRASVNSYGFGGANAHAILEGYDQPHQEQPKQDEPLFTPFVFSAYSQQSLRVNLEAYLRYLEDDDGRNINMHDLAWTLRWRRSVFGWRTSIVASSAESLRDKLRTMLDNQDLAKLGNKALPSSQNRVLGIFTGQGAQYARMGAELIQQSVTARGIIQKLESCLGELREAPAWSLEAELLAEALSTASASRVNQAFLSQPLCTAIQILLVDLLRFGGVEFHAVMGHSSGEIGAAYAAGYLTARDAMCIAYYRGIHVEHASSRNGPRIKGAMVAAGTTPEDAAELCGDKVFAGRVVVAAINSPTSVTFSGDEDAIAELEIILDDEGKFYRRLKVDRAYHSPHMLSCVDRYVESLRRCHVTWQRGSNSCTWFSSVDGLPVTDGDDITTTSCEAYWARNMTEPVLFSQTLSQALTNQPPDVVLEIGPHDALKAPATETIKTVLEKGLPYSGTLSRGTSSIEALSSAFGFLWEYLGPAHVDLGAYQRAMASGQEMERHSYHVVKGLPTYCWNHETKYWHESRRSHKLRQRKVSFHPLLGHATEDSAPHHMSWRNLLRVSEMEWLSGHQVQGQVVLPAAAYVCTALEAARFVAMSVAHTARDVRLLELRDFSIQQAVTFPDDDDRGVEVLISMSSITQIGPDRTQAEFTYSAARPCDDGAQDLSIAATCHVEILFGKVEDSLLPARKPAVPHMIDVESDRFYAALSDLGYGFSGRFRALTGMRRKRCKSSALITVSPEQRDDASESGLLIHPSHLDAALQSIILAYGYPYDEQLQSMHLPTTIRSIRLNPALVSGTQCRGHKQLFVIDATVEEPRQTCSKRGVTGHVNLYTNSSAHAFLQIQRAAFVPLGGGAASPNNERKVFSKIEWVNSHPDGLEAAREILLTEEHHTTVKLLERIATFYLRKFDREVAPDHPKRSEFPTNCYLNFARHVTSMVESGQHKWAEKDWLGDTLETVMDACRQFEHLPDVEIMHLVGTQMPRVLDGETTMLEQFRADGNGILDRYYASGFGLKESAQWVSRSVKQIVDRYPHMSMMEIGAGTGGATKAIFREIGQSFLSYTYTDISAAFFETAASTFAQQYQQDRVLFKTFDVERDPVEQGYSPHSYDLVVAFFVIHATSDIARCLRNIRKLLKPGGFLVVGEGLEGQNGVASSGFIFGTLPGWWLGADAGRTLSPHIAPGEWEALLQSTGFSGIETSPPEEFEQVLNVFHFVSQAVDDQVTFFRAPLITAPSFASTWTPPPIDKLVIIGGQTSRTWPLVQGLQNIFSRRNLALNVYCFPALLDVDHDLLMDVSSTVVSLTELDRPVFKDMTKDTFEAIKSIFSMGKTLLWVTSGRRDDEPFSNMTVGFGRTAANETPDLRLQQLDVEDPDNTTPEFLAQTLLRLHATAGEDHVWTVEPEIVVDNEGHELLPRLKPIPELNDRYTSARRVFLREEEDLTMATFPVALQVDSTGGFLLQELHAPCTENLPEAPSRSAEPNNRTLVGLRTTHSLLSSLRTPAGSMFLVSATQADARTYHLALVSEPVSRFNLPADRVVPCPDGLAKFPQPEILSMLSAHLIAAEALGSKVLEGQLLIVHNPSNILARAFSLQAAAKGIKIVFTTDSTDSFQFPESWIRLPRYMTESDMEELLLPLNPSAFIGLTSLGGKKVQSCKNENAIIKCLSHCCSTLMTAKMLCSFASSDPNRQPTSKATASVLRQTLARALWYLEKDMSTTEAAVPAQEVSTIPLNVLVRESGDARGPEEPLSVVDWTADAPVPVHVTQLDINGMFNSHNSTYWIVGMTRDLGISLADWMISKGARNLVLTSRQPEIEESWIASHRQKGANVVVLTCDVTDEKALISVHATICSTLPPVRGVIHGAMVLRDTSIANMEFDQLTDVLGPKVDGSIYLDRIFDGKVDLDFFVFVSSINHVIGNVGQANYAAANAFMCSLAAQRRKRGLRSAAVNGGAIVGAGYMNRESRKELDEIVRKLYMMRMSEEDWCQSICEAIDACRLQSPHGPELTTGLSDVPFDTPNAPNWYSNPKFSSFIVHNRPHGGENMDSKAKIPQIAELLEGCQSRHDLFLVVKSAFATQLRTILQVTTSDEDIMACRSGELGLDSLVSVDIRHWLLKNLRVNIPVLRIMSNDTMQSLVSHAVDNLPADLVPGLSRDEASSAPLLSESKTSTTAGEDDGSSSLSGTASESSSSTSKTSASETTGMDPITHDANSRDAKFVAHSHNHAIDWEAESCPAEDLATLALDLPPQTTITTGATRKGMVVVLTGCTGLLGHHLLSRLLALNNHTIAKVICLAVRSLSSRRQQLPNNPRVVYYEGDLSHSLLGLTQDQATSIFTEADVVIHNGADTSHLKHYTQLRAANVDSTKTLARLCLFCNVPLHYISSAGVAMLHDTTTSEEKAPFSPGPVRLGQGGKQQPDGSFGYLCSKWISEKLLERINKSYNLPVYIHRPSTIIRQGADAVGEAAERDWVNALLQYSQRIRAVPKAGANRGVLDLVRVDSVCEEIIGRVLGGGDGDRNASGVRFVHEVGDVIIPLDQLQEQLDLEEKEEETLVNKRHGCVRVLDRKEWIVEAIAAGMRPGVAALIEAMDDGEGEWPALLKGDSDGA